MPQVLLNSKTNKQTAHNNSSNNQLSLASLGNFTLGIKQKKKQKKRNRKQQTRQNIKATTKSENLHAAFIQFISLGGEYF